MAVGALDDKVSRGKDGGRSTDALQGETGEGFEQYCEAGGHQEGANGPKERETQERWTETPAGDPPRDESGYGAGGEYKKSCSSQDGERSPGPVLRFPPICHLDLFRFGSVARRVLVRLWMIPQLEVSSTRMLCR